MGMETTPTTEDNFSSWMWHRLPSGRLIWGPANPPGTWWAAQVANHTGEGAR